MCMCVCVCVCVYACMHARVHVLVCLFVCVWVYAGARMSVCVRVHMHKIVRPCAEIPLDSLIWKEFLCFNCI